MSILWANEAEEYLISSYRKLASEKKTEAVNAYLIKNSKGEGERGEGGEREVFIILQSESVSRSFDFLSIYIEKWNEMSQPRKQGEVKSNRKLVSNWIVTSCRFRTIRLCHNQMHASKLFFFWPNWRGRYFFARRRHRHFLPTHCWAAGHWVAVSADSATYLQLASYSLS